MIVNKTSKTLTQTAAAALVALGCLAVSSLPAQAAAGPGASAVADEIGVGNGSTVLDGLLGGSILGGGVLNGGVVNGPLIDGPLVDFGNVGPFQFGQFQ